MLVWILHFCLVAVAIIIASYIVPGIVVKNFGVALLAALVLGLVNVVLGPVLNFLALPLTILTLGLFKLVINGLLLKLAAELVDGFEVKGWLDAILGSLLISIVSVVLTRVLL
jgi:putative membrane protein